MRFMRIVPLGVESGEEVFGRGGALRERKRPCWGGGMAEPCGAG
jgi:hypothetical protein